MPKPSTGGGKIKLVRQGQTAAKLYGTDPAPTYPAKDFHAIRDLKP